MISILSALGVSLAVEIVGSWSSIAEYLYYARPPSKGRAEPSDQNIFHAEDVIVDGERTSYMIGDSLRFTCRDKFLVMSCGVCGDNNSGDEVSSEPRFAQ
jgi:hypothetical protein